MSTDAEWKARQYIRSDAVIKTVNPEKQSRHEIGSEKYVNGRSYLLPGIDAKKLLRTGLQYITAIQARI